MGAGKDHADQHRLRIVTGATEGHSRADGHDIVREFRAARPRSGWCPQELGT